MDNRQNVVELNDNNVYQKLLEVIKKLYVIKKFDTFNNDEKEAINKILEILMKQRILNFQKKILNKEINENKCLCSLDCLKYNGKLFGLC